MGWWRKDFLRDDGVRQPLHWMCQESGSLSLLRPPRLLPPSQIQRCLLMIFIHPWFGFNIAWRGKPSWPHLYHTIRYWCTAAQKIASCRSAKSRKTNENKVRYAGYVGYNKIRIITNCYLVGGDFILIRNYDRTKWANIGARKRGVAVFCFLKIRPPTV